MRTLVFLVEGPSEREALGAWLPKLVPQGVAWHFIVFQGKQDMERRMVRLMKHWRTPDTRFIILRDQDSADCGSVKSALKERCLEAGRGEAVVRIACHELENFFLGDWAAVGRAYGLPRLAALDRQASYREPDRAANPKQELRRHVPEWQPLDGARRIAATMDPSNNRSRSFCHLRDAIVREATRSAS